MMIKLPSLTPGMFSSLLAERNKQGMHMWHVLSRDTVGDFKALGRPHGYHVRLRHSIAETSPWPSNDSTTLPALNQEGC